MSHLLLHTIGRTPLIELKRLSPKPGIRLFAKLEGQNPSGSVKDRIALALVEALEQRHQLKPGATLIEASTGNTAIALAMVARQRGYNLKVVIPYGVVSSIADILNLYGVEVIWVRPKAGMGGAIDETRRLAEENGWFAVGQFDNPINASTHYQTTGGEIARALPRTDVFVAGIGTGGTLMGVGRRLRELNPNLKLIGVEPRLGECLQGLRIIREEGIMAGVSSGATFHAALRVAERMERGNIVMMFSDGGWKYLPSRPWDAAKSGDPCLDETHWW